MTAPAASWSWRSPRVWLVPALAVVAGATLLATGANVQAFLTLNRLGRGWSDSVWADITILGDTMVVLTISLVFARRVPIVLWAVVPVGLLATAWSNILKLALHLPRPATVLGVNSMRIVGPIYYSHSFPSGHATAAFALAGVCVLGFDLGWWSVAPVLGAALIGLSRCAVGAHWPLDLAGGALGGWLAAAAGLRLAPRMRYGLRADVQGALTAALACCAIVVATLYRTGYPQALGFQRLIGVLALTALGITLRPLVVTRERTAVRPVDDHPLG